MCVAKQAEDEHSVVNAVGAGGVASQGVLTLNMALHQAQWGLDLQLGDGAHPFLDLWLHSVGRIRVSSTRGG